jgi:hypothetical protein
MIVRKTRRGNRMIMVDPDPPAALSDTSRRFDFTRAVSQLRSRSNL